MLEVINFVTAGFSDFSFFSKHQKYDKYMTYKELHCRMMSWCVWIVIVTLNASGTGSIPSHDTKVNSAFHPSEIDK